MTPMFSVVMASFLGSYPGAAKDREAKFRRAVDSVLAQTFMGWELRIVADGCDKTAAIYDTHYATSCRIHLSQIEKRPLWCSGVRNRGIADSTGEWIVYLDTDDEWTPEHLQVIRKGLTDPPPHGWAYFNAWFYNARLKTFLERAMDIDKCKTYGTANIVHRNIPGLLWPPTPTNRVGQNDYSRQDCAFVDTLKELGKGIRIPTPGYKVCHDAYVMRYDV